MLYTERILFKEMKCKTNGETYFKSSELYGEIYTDKTENYVKT